MKDRASLYNQIVQNLEKGELKKEFSFPVLILEGEPVYAMDGMLDTLYLMHPDPDAQIDAKGAKKISRALTAAFAGDVAVAEQLFSELGAEYRAVACASYLQAYIRRHEDRNSRALFDTAVRLVTESGDRECVKFGLCILERFVITNEALKKLIFTVGLSDEFTLFAGYAMTSWEDADRHLFTLVRHVHGWGRIALLPRISSGTAARRNWILRHGMENTVNENYLAAVCFQMARAAERLKRPMKPDQFSAVTALIDRMTDEDPAPGLTALPDPESVLNDYLDRAAETEPDTETYNLIARLFDWASEYGFWEIADRCEEQFLLTEDCRKKALYAARCGEALDLACVLGIPFEEDLLRHMELDFDRFFDKCGYLLDTGDYAEQVLDLFRKRVDPDSFAGEPVTDFTIQGRSRRETALEYLLEELSYLPMTGTDLVAAGLRFPGVWVRGRAVFTLTSWVSVRGVPLRELSPELFDAVFELSQKEPVHALSEVIWKLLAGATVFEEEEWDDRD